MHIGFAAVALLLASSSAIPTKRQALLDSIGQSSLDDVVKDIKDNGNITLLGDLLEVAIDALSNEASAVADCYNPSATKGLGSGFGSSSGGAGSANGGGVSSGGVGAAAGSNAASQLSSLLSSVASAATSAPNTANNAAAGVNAAASSALDFLSANPAATVAPAISSLLSSIAAGATGATLPTAAASSLVDAASSVGAAPIAGITAGATASVGGAVTIDPAVASFLSSLLAGPAVTAAPALSSVLSSLANNPSISISPALSSALSSLGGNTAAIPTAAVSSIISAISSGATVPRTTSAPASSGTPIACPFKNDSTRDYVGSEFKLYCNQFYGGKVLAGLRKRQAASSLNQCASLCSVNPLCLGTQYDPSSNACTFYSTLTNGVTKNGVQFALRGSAAGSVLPPVSASGAVSATGGISVGPLPTRISTGINAGSTTLNPSFPALSSVLSQITGASSLNPSFISSIISDITALPSSALPTGGASSLISSILSEATGAVSTGINAGSTGLNPSFPALSSVLSQITGASSLSPSFISSIVSGITALPTSVLPTGAASSLISDISVIATAVDPSGVISSILSEATGAVSTGLNAGSSILNPSFPALSSVVASITSDVGTIPTSVLPSGIISSLLSDGSSIITAVPTSLLPSGVVSSVLAGITTTSVDCSGPLGVCVSLGIGPSLTVTLGVNAGNGGVATNVPALTSFVPTTISGALITGATTSCDGLVCVSLGVGPLATVTLGVLNPSGVIGGSVGLGGGASVTAAPSFVPTTISGALITGASTSCDGLVCVNLGIGPSATVTLGVLNPSNVVGGSVGLGGASVTAAPSFVPTTISGALITGATTSCDGLVCVNLGIGPLATVTLGVLNPSGVVGGSVGLGGGASVTAAPSFVPTTISGALITGATTSCDGLVCVSLGVGPLATVTLGVLNPSNVVGGSVGLGATPSSVVAGVTSVVGGIVSGASSVVNTAVPVVTSAVGGAVTGVTSVVGGVTSLVGGIGLGGGAGASASVTGAASVPSNVISGVTVTRTTTRCAGLVCITVGVGPIASVTIGALSPAQLAAVSLGLLRREAVATTLATVVRK